MDVMLPKLAEMQCLKRVDQLRDHALCLTLTKPKFASLRKKMELELEKAEVDYDTEKIKGSQRNDLDENDEGAVDFVNEVLKKMTRKQSMEDELFCMDGALDRYEMIKELDACMGALVVDGRLFQAFNEIKDALTKMQDRVKPEIKEFIQYAREIHRLKKIPGMKNLFSDYKREAQIYLLNLRIQSLTNVLNNASRMGEETKVRDNVLCVLQKNLANLGACHCDLIIASRIPTGKITKDEPVYDNTVDQNEFFAKIKKIQRFMLTERLKGDTELRHGMSEVRGENHGEIRLLREQLKPALKEADAGRQFAAQQAKDILDAKQNVATLEASEKILRLANGDLQQTREDLAEQVRAGAAALALAGVATLRVQRDLETAKQELVELQGSRVAFEQAILLRTQNEISGVREEMARSLKGHADKMVALEQSHARNIANIHGEHAAAALAREGIITALRGEKETHEAALLTNAATITALEDKIRDLKGTPVDPKASQDALERAVAVQLDRVTKELVGVRAELAASITASKTQLAAKDNAFTAAAAKHAAEKTALQEKMAATTSRFDEGASKCFIAEQSFASSETTITGLRAEIVVLTRTGDTIRDQRARIGELEQAAFEHVASAISLKAKLTESEMTCTAKTTAGELAGNRIKTLENEQREMRASTEATKQSLEADIKRIMSENVTAALKIKEETTRKQAELAAIYRTHLATIKTIKAEVDNEIANYKSEKAALTRNQTMWKKELETATTTMLEGTHAKLTTSEAENRELKHKADVFRKDCEKRILFLDEEVKRSLNIQKLEKEAHTKELGIATTKNDRLKESTDSIIRQLEADLALNKRKDATIIETGLRDRIRLLNDDLLVKNGQLTGVLSEISTKDHNLALIQAQLAAEKLQLEGIRLITAHEKKTRDESIAEVNRALDLKVEENTRLVSENQALRVAAAVQSGAQSDVDALAADNVNLRQYISAELQRAQANETALQGRVDQQTAELVKMDGVLKEAATQIESKKIQLDNEQSKHSSEKANLEKKYQDSEAKAYDETQKHAALLQDFKKDKVKSDKKNALKLAKAETDVQQLHAAIKAAQLQISNQPSDDGSDVDASDSSSDSDASGSASDTGAPEPASDTGAPEPADDEASDTELQRKKPHRVSAPTRNIDASAVRMILPPDQYITNVPYERGRMANTALQNFIDPTPTLDDSLLTKELREQIRLFLIANNATKNGKTLTELIVFFSANKIPIPYLLREYIRNPSDLFLVDGLKNYAIISNDPNIIFGRAGVRNPDGEDGSENKRKLLNILNELIERESITDSRTDPGNKKSKSSSTVPEVPRAVEKPMAPTIFSFHAFPIDLSIIQQQLELHLNEMTQELQLTTGTIDQIKNFRKTADSATFTNLVDFYKKMHLRLPPLARETRDPSQFLVTNDEDYRYLNFAEKLNSATLRTRLELIETQFSGKIEFRHANQRPLLIAQPELPVEPTPGLFDKTLKYTKGLLPDSVSSYFAKKEPEQIPITQNKDQIAWPKMSDEDKNIIIVKVSNKLRSTAQKSAVKLNSGQLATLQKYIKDMKIHPADELRRLCGTLGIGEPFLLRYEKSETGKYAIIDDKSRNPIFTVIEWNGAVDLNQEILAAYLTDCFTVSGGKSATSVGIVQGIPLVDTVEQELKRFLETTYEGNTAEAEQLFTRLVKTNPELMAKTVRLGPTIKTVEFKTEMTRNSAPTQKWLFDVYTKNKKTIPQPYLMRLTGRDDKEIQCSNNPSLLLPGHNWGKRSNPNIDVMFEHLKRCLDVK